MSIDANTDFAALQKLLRKPKLPAPGERCDFCSAALAHEHGHLIDLKARRIMCGCRPCALTFEPQGAAGGRYRIVPTRYRKVEDLDVDDATWDTLQLPIGLAFFFYNSIDRKMAAFYPGPAGATESELPLEEWQALVAANPTLATLEPDVEAILLRRLDGVTKVYLIPIDAAYELVGLIRMNWRGFDGGAESKANVDGFFARIEARA